MSSFGYYNSKSEPLEGIKTFDIDFENYPPLLLKLKYKDLHNKNHVKKFKLQFKFYTWVEPAGLTEENCIFGDQLLVSTEI